MAAAELYRRQVALRCGFNEITGRLIGFLHWMKQVPIIKQVMK